MTEEVLALSIVAAVLALVAAALIHARRRRLATASILARMPQANPLHYGFAHQLLPRLVHHEPDRTNEALKAPDHNERLELLWRHLAKTIGTAPPEPPPRTTVARVGGQELVLVHLPPPRTAPEAYFCAILFGEGKASYFTLERGVEPRDGGDGRPVVGEWTADGSHRNYGSVGTPTIEDFLATVQDVMGRRLGPSAESRPGG